MARKTGRPKKDPSQKGKLTKQQIQAIDLMVNENKNKVETSSILDIARTTLDYWFKNTTFLDEYLIARKQKRITSMAGVDEANLIVAKIASPKCTAERRLAYELAGEMEGEKMKPVTINLNIPNLKIHPQEA